MAPRRTRAVAQDRESSPDSGGKATLVDLATRTVRDHILDLSLSPGMNLDERYLLERFPFGRTPMREALNRLIVEELVVPGGRRGVQVAPLNIETTVQLFDAYVMSERMVAASLRFDDPDLVIDLVNLHNEYVQHLGETDLLRVTELNALFHRRLARATNNRFVEAYSNRLHNLARRLSYYIYRREASEEGFSRTLFRRPKRDHEHIIDAIKASDRERLVEVLTEHAVFFRKRLARIIKADRSAKTDFSALLSEE